MCTYSLEQLANIYVFTDLGVCILYTVALLWLHFFVNRESSQVARLFLSLDRYSIWIPRLPPGCGEIPLAQYFEELTGENVDEVNIAFDDGQLISLFIERERDSLQKIVKVRRIIKISSIPKQSRHGVRPDRKT